MSDPKYCFSIGVVASRIDVPTHVIRFWESQFVFAKPSTRVNNQRRYCMENIFIFACIHYYLYRKKYTIKGVLDIYNANEKKHFIDHGRSILFSDSVSAIDDIKKDIINLKSKLEKIKGILY